MCIIKISSVKHTSDIVEKAKQLSRTSYSITFLVVAITCWFLLGEPRQTVANWLWTNDAAPWETVDAYYYPNRANLVDVRYNKGLGSVQECRNWVRTLAASQGDTGIVRGDYECGVQVIDFVAGIPVYRITLR